MKKNQIFKTRFLKAADLGGKPVVATIAHASCETLKSFGGAEETKVVLNFVGGGKVLPVNSVNWDSLVTVTGHDDSDMWAGVKIELFPSTTQLNGGTVDCVRIRKPTPPDQPPLPGVGDGMNDAIPF